jgi:hypothetical protein
VLNIGIKGKRRFIIKIFLILKKNAWLICFLLFAQTYTVKNSPLLRNYRQNYIKALIISNTESDLNTATKFKEKRTVRKPEHPE